MSVTLPPFPIVLANGPPATGLQEVAEGGVNMVRTGRGDWKESELDGQIAAERARLESAAYEQRVAGGLADGVRVFLRT